MALFVGLTYTGVNAACAPAADSDAVPSYRGRGLLPALDRLVDQWNALCARLEEVRPQFHSPHRTAQEATLARPSAAGRRGRSCGEG